MRKLHAAPEVVVPSAGMVPSEPPPSGAAVPTQIHARAGIPDRVLWQERRREGALRALCSQQSQWCSVWGGVTRQSIHPCRHAACPLRLTDSLVQRVVCRLSLQLALVCWGHSDFERFGTAITHTLLACWSLVTHVVTLETPSLLLAFTYQSCPDTSFACVFASACVNRPVHGVAFDCFPGPVDLRSVRRAHCSACVSSLLHLSAERIRLAGRYLVRVGRALALPSSCLFSACHGCPCLHKGCLCVGDH